MNVGDRIRLSAKPACQALGVSQDQIGVIRNVDAGCERTAVLISFPEVNVYTSALNDDDIEVVRHDVGVPAKSPKREG